MKPDWWIIDLAIYLRNGFICRIFFTRCKCSCTDIGWLVPAARPRVGLLPLGSSYPLKSPTALLSAAIQIDSHRGTYAPCFGSGCPHREKRWSRQILGGPPRPATTYGEDPHKRAPHRTGCGWHTRKRVSPAQMITPRQGAGPTACQPGPPTPATLLSSASTATQPPRPGPPQQRRRH